MPRATKIQGPFKNRPKVERALAIAAFMACLLAPLLTIAYLHFFEGKRHIVEPVLIEIKDSVAFKDEFLNKIFEINLEHPYVVFAQALQEIGHFTSPLSKENHNAFGMKRPWRRATLAIGINKGHAVFKNWEHSLFDYALFQSAFMRGLSEEDYLDKLAKSYAEDPEYKAKIKAILKTIR